MVLFICASLPTLGFLSLSQYIHVGYSVQKYAKYALSNIRSITAIFAITPTFGISMFAYKAGAHQCEPYDNSPSGTMYFIVMAIVVILIPIITILYCYYKLCMMAECRQKESRRYRECQQHGAKSFFC